MTKEVMCLLITILTITHVYSQTKESRCEIWRNQADTITSSNALLKFNEQMIAEVDDVCKMKIYMNSAFIMYESKRKVDSSLYYSNKAIEIGINIQEEELLAETYTLKADTYFLNNEFDKGIISLSKAKKILKNNPNTKSWILFYQSYSELHDNKGDFQKAINYTDSAITISKRIKNDIELAVCYHNRGLFNYRLSKFEEAIEDLLLAINLKENQKQPDGIARTYYLLGNCYVKWEQYEIAKKYLFKSIPLAKKEGNDFLLILNYSFLVECYLEMNENDKAIEYIDKALGLAKKLQNNERIFQALIQKGWFYFNNLKKYDLAEQYFKKAYHLTDSIRQEKDQYLFRCYHALLSLYIQQERYEEAKKYLAPYKEAVRRLGILNEVKKMHKTISEFYEKTGDNANALAHLKNYYKIKDSISGVAVKTKVADLEKKYDTKKKELEIVNLNQEKEEQRQITKRSKAKQNLYLLVTSFLLFLLVVGALAFRKVRKQQKELSETNQVKNRLFSIIAHDLRGMMIPFQRSGKILKHHIDKGNHQKTIELSQTLEQNSESLSNMLDNLLNWSLEQMNGYKMNPEKIAVAEELYKITKGYDQQAAYKKTKIELKYTENVCFHMDKGAFHVIFRNLIGNALKYTEEGYIRIEFKTDEDQFLCSIVDTGVGMSSDQLGNLFTLEEKKSTVGTQGEKGTGLGLNLVYRFIKMHDGAIQVSSEKRIGTRFDLSIPITIALTKEKGAVSESLSA